MLSHSQKPLAAALTALLLASAHAYQIPRTTGFARRQASGTTTAAGASITAVTGCHMHGTTQYCVAGDSEFQVKTSGKSEDLPKSYTGCHNHGATMFCVGPSGDDVEMIGEGAEEESGHDDHDHAAATTTAEAGPMPTQISECHLHGTDVFCMAGTVEYQVLATPSAPAAYTGCHSHGTDNFCVDSNGEDIQVLAPGQQESTASESSSSEPEEKHCHFHAGVEHCVGGSESESSRSCEKVDRDYDIPLRVGLLFVMLVTSAVGVFTPIFLTKWGMANGFMKTVFSVLKQFGTGVIISTAFVHLYTHAELMFGNECLGELQYEGTTSAIFMAGLFLSFVIEFFSHKFMHATISKKVTEGDSATLELHRANNKEVVSLFVLEAGIIFHSLIIGITLVVAGDSFFKILFVVIIFHQMFEGIALGTRIAAAGHTSEAAPHQAGAECAVPSLSLFKKLLMAAGFAVVTPVGMAIGIGVLDQFNGNDPSTIIAIGTLDAVSAGILAWVGVVEMWAGDWMFGGEMDRAPPLMATIGGVGLIAGMALMSFIGKWA